MNEEGLAQERAQLARLERIHVAWSPLKEYLQELRAEQVEKLVTREDSEARGRIKQIDELLDLPSNIQRAQTKLRGLSE